MTLQVLHYDFDYSDPFVAGHVCSEADARMLNQQRQRIIRLKVSRRIERLAGKGILNAEQLATVQQYVDDVQSKFSWPVEAAPVPRVKSLDHHVDEIITEMQARRGTQMAPEEVEALRNDDSVKTLALHRLDTAHRVAKRLLEEYF